MKKLSLFAAFFMLIQVSFAGGLLTNTNQSAQFIRMMSRNASTDIDGVYFNPAGLIKLEDGWHFAFYSQTIFQDKTVDSKFPLLNDGHYVGKVTIPVFPTAFAVYKKENWAFSLGFGPNAGGGSADFDRGLPSFEIPITKVVPGLAGLTQIDPALNVTGYDAELSFSGSSVYWGIQLGATYKVNDVLSVYGGVRYLPSKNVYEGSIRNIQLQVAGQYFAAPTWLSGTAGTVGNLATMASAAAATLGGTANNLQPIIDGGGGDYTLAQLEGAGQIDAATRAAIEGGLQSLGLSSAQIDAMNMTQIHGTYSTAASEYNGKAAVLSGTATTLEETAGNLADKEVKTEQTGAGFTPMLGVQISPTENLNIAVKYEMKTILKLKNDTEVDDLGLFPDGAESRNDVPAILGIGIGYKPADWLETQFSYTGYFNKGVDWGYNTRYLAGDEMVKREIDKNGYELGLGLQFNLSGKFALSVGGLYGDMGVADSYQSDFSYSNPSFTIGGGVMWKITEKLVFDAGVSNTYYQDQTITFSDPDLGSYNETLGKTTLNFAAGLSYSIF
jgi:long-subunit fatty acid transport protein